jgi:hypothetical protein
MASQEKYIENQEKDEKIVKSNVQYRTSPRSNELIETTGPNSIKYGTVKGKTNPKQ